MLLMPDVAGRCLLGPLALDESISFFSATPTSIKRSRNPHNGEGEYVTSYHQGLGRRGSRLAPSESSRSSSRPVVTADGTEVVVWPEASIIEKNRDYRRDRRSRASGGRRAQVNQDLRTRPRRGRVMVYLHHLEQRTLRMAVNLFDLRRL